MKRLAPALHVADDIVPIAHFKAHASELMRDLHTRMGRPLVITNGGRAAGVLVTPEEYDRLTYTERFNAAIDEGLADADAGRVFSHDEVAAEMRARFAARRGPKKKKKA
jgi:prevent-host-death family protein